MLKSVGASGAQHKEWTGGLRPVYVYLTKEEVKRNKRAEEYPVTLEHQTNQNFIFNMSRSLRCLRYFYTKK